jgi:hypothetical protein
MSNVFKGPKKDPIVSGYESAMAQESAKQQAAAANSGAAAAALRTDVDTVNVGGDLRGTAGNAARALAFQDEASRRRPAAKVLLGS